MEKALKICAALIPVWFFIVHPLVIYWIKQMDDPWKLKFVFGKMGTGKTGLIAIWSIKDLTDQRFKHVYTSCGIPGTKKFDPADIGKGFTFPPYSSVYIDEFGLLYNSRDFKTFPKAARKWFKYLRQSKCKVTIFSQAPDIDKSIRDLAHEYGLLRRIGPFSILFDVSKNIDIGQDIEGNGQLIDNYFKLGILGGMHIFYLPRYFGLWDSFDPPEMDLIADEYVDPTPGLIRAMRFKRWYRWNFRKVYEWLYRRVSAISQFIYTRYLKGTFFVPGSRFKSLQYLN